MHRLFLLLVFVVRLSSNPPTPPAIQRKIITNSPPFLSLLSRARCGRLRSPVLWWCRPRALLLRSLRARRRRRWDRPRTAPSRRRFARRASSLATRTFSSCVARPSPVRRRTLFLLFILASHLFLARLAPRRPLPVHQRVLQRLRRAEEGQPGAHQEGEDRRQRPRLPVISV